MFCQNCGTENTNANAKFCISCGTSLGENKQPSSNISYCSSCGAIIDNNQKYCSQCEQEKNVTISANVTTQKINTFNTEQKNSEQDQIEQEKFIQGFSWGAFGFSAFGLGVIWFSFRKLWWAAVIVLLLTIAEYALYKNKELLHMELLIIVSVIGLFICVYLGFIGRKMAWNEKQKRGYSFAIFQNEEKKWDKDGIYLSIAAIFLNFMLIGAYREDKQTKELESARKSYKIQSCEMHTLTSLESKYGYKYNTIKLKFKGDVLPDDINVYATYGVNFFDDTKKEVAIKVVDMYAQKQHNEFYIATIPDANGTHVIVKSEYDGEEKSFVRLHVTSVL